MPGQPPIALTPAGAGVYLLAGLDGEITLQSDPRGVVYGLRLQQDGHVVYGLRLQQDGHIELAMKAESSAAARDQ